MSFEDSVHRIVSFLDKNPVYIAIPLVLGCLYFIIRYLVNSEVKPKHQKKKDLPPDSITDCKLSITESQTSEPEYDSDPHEYLKLFEIVTRFSLHNPKNHYYKTRKGKSDHSEEREFFLNR